ncbi:hypothetical protein [Sphingomonas parapaucimobilis]|uniref:hypothetical protein n=1 Tax=Sphingomonas parapaucimobilis TaxID=28213 RepID=UPI0035C8274B
MKATIICTPGCGGVDLRAAGAVIVTMAGDHALKSERMVAADPTVTIVFQRRLRSPHRNA